MKIDKIEICLWIIGICMTVYFICSIIERYGGD